MRILVRLAIIFKVHDNINEGLYVMDIKISFSTDDLSFEISGAPVGSLTGSKKKDFYVYEWFIKDTGEIFYVGKGRKNRYKEFHETAYMAEKIRSIYKTDARFVGENLTEEEAVELEDAEMMRILNETTDRLTNRITPLFADRDNGYGQSCDTPTLVFEKAPVLYANEIENHYFGIQWRAFDEPILENLNSVVFIMGDTRDVLEDVYGGDIERYRSETVAQLKTSGKKILKSKFAKSVSAWIYIGIDHVTNYDINMERAQKELNRKIPVYHLIDVWRLLNDSFGNINTDDDSFVEVHPENNRVPIEQILHVDFDTGYKNGVDLWYKGETLQKSGQLDEAIKLLDQARYQGYSAPALYNTYAVIYRKLKDYDNEIDILREAITRFRQAEFGGVTEKVLRYQERLDKAIELKREFDIIHGSKANG